MSLALQMERGMFSSNKLTGCIQVAESPPPPLAEEVKEVEPEPELVRVLQLPLDIQEYYITSRDKITDSIQAVESPPPPPEEEAKDPEPVSKFSL
jgi:hypothetical protein